MKIFKDSSEAAATAAGHFLNLLCFRLTSLVPVAEKQS